MSRLLDGRFDLARHAELKHRDEESVLVMPERALRIGGSGGEILALCEAGGTGRELVDRLARRYPEQSGIEASVLAFLEEMLELGGVTLCESEVKDEREATSRPARGTSR